MQSTLPEEAAPAAFDDDAVLDAVGLADDPQAAIPSAMTSTEMTPSVLVTADRRLDWFRCECKTNPHWPGVPRCAFRSLPRQARIACLHRPCRRAVSVLPGTMTGWQPPASGMYQQVYRPWS